MLEKLFAQYAAGHTHPMNRFFHLLGIPTIAISLCLLILDGPSKTFWITFTLGWVFQFIGHAIERTMPEFLKNPLFLAIGPLYFLHKILLKLKK